MALVPGVNVLGFRQNAVHRLILVTAVVGALVGCRPGAPADPKIRNVIVVVVDTLRADHLGCYGYSRDTSPNLDRFANDNLLFSRVRSQASCTYPSVNSLLTSTYPYRFLNQPNGEMGIPEQTRSLPEILKMQGMATIAVSASPIVRRPSIETEPHGDFSRGFDIFDSECMHRSAECVNRQALTHIARVKQPFLAYLHYFEPHNPYRPPQHFKRKYAGEFFGPEFIRLGNPNPLELMVYRDGPQLELDDDSLNHLVDLYDDEISYFDDQFAQLLDALRRRRLMDNTIIVVASDHGEDFLQEHGHVKHCHTLYEAVTRTPLMMRIPGVERDRPIEVMVENVDIVPTIFDYLGLDVADLGLEGRSLRGAIERDEPVHEFVFSLQDAMRSADDGRLKLIADLSSNQSLLFDLHDDPGELENLFSTATDGVALLEQALSDWRLRHESGVDVDDAVLAAEAAQERLRAIGYLQ